MSFPLNATAITFDALRNWDIYRELFEVVSASEGILDPLICSQGGEPGFFSGGIIHISSSLGMPRQDEIPTGNKQENEKDFKWLKTSEMFLFEITLAVICR